MLGSASVVGFVPVSNFKAAEEFYAGKLGLTVLDRDNPYALVLRAADGVMIRCTLAGSTKPQPFTILGWQVRDLRSAVQELIAAGVQPAVYPGLPQTEDGIMTFPGGDMVVWFNDPFGNVLSLSQHT